MTTMTMMKNENCGDNDDDNDDDNNDGSNDDNDDYNDGFGSHRPLGIVSTETFGRSL